MSDARMFRPIIFMSRNMGEQGDPAVRDFRPANQIGTPPRVIVPVTTVEEVEVETVPKDPDSSATGSVPDSGDESSNDLTPKDETKNLNSPSPSSENPASAEKGKTPLHPSMMLGKIEPPAKV